MKKFLKYTGISLLILIVLAFLIPVLFKGKILKLVKSEINKNIEAKVDFDDLDISLFRHFPKITLSLNKISVAGKGAFEADTLLSANRFDASVDIMSLISGKNIKIHGIYLGSPRIHALVNADGQANWDIAKQDTAKTSESPGEPSSFAMKLEEYAIEDGYIFYEDRQAGMKAEISGLDHKGSGDFTDDRFLLSTSTKAGTASFTYENIPYLAGVKTAIDADFEVDNSTSTYHFKGADISVNELNLKGDGFFRLVNDSTYGMDISFNAPSNEFRHFLSLVPAIYKSGFDKLKTSGTAAFKGFVKGEYSPSRMPAYEVDLTVKDGFFQYPDLPQPVQHIDIAARLSNSDGRPDNTVIDITKGHLELGKEPFDFKLLFRNPETARYIDALVKGSLDLGQLGSFIKLDAGTKLAGMLKADVFAKGNLLALEGQGGAFNAGGSIDISRLSYASPAFPQPISNGSLAIALANSGGTADATTVNISSGHLELGRDPIDFTLQIQKPVSDLNFSGTARGRFTLDNIKQFTALEPGTSVTGVMEADVAYSGSKADIDKGAYDKINTTGTVSLNNVNYVSADYPEGLKLQQAKLQFNPKNIALQALEADFKQTHFSANGILNNLLGYAMHNEPLRGTVNVSANKLNLNDWMGSDTATASTATAPATASAASTAPFPVPANIDMTLNATAGSLTYDKVVYSNVKGTLLVKDETVQLQNVQTEALGGQIAFGGSYGTKTSKTQPDVSLTYAIKDVDVQKAFLAYNTMQKLMPLGKFLSGKLSSQFSMTGKLNGEMMPDLGSLTGNGNFLLLQGVLSKFQPLDKLATTLNVDALKDISLKDIKTHFEFANGKVLVKPFNVKIKDIDMQIGGMHGIDQSISYIIAMKIPRSYLGASGNALVNNLAAQATAKGIPVTVSDIVDLHVNMGGSITNPVIKTDLKQAAGDASKELKQQAAAFVQQKVDSTKQTVKDSLTVVKKQVVSDVKNELASQLLGKKDSSGGGGSLDSTKKKAEQTIKNTFNGLLKKKKG
ncbi:MAG TPA: AsmA-like C-terminal region-containing protein [Flavisolibacter sp.]|nr:AsmA-like C-terminal region-containing protein [Flavisolibacter sp.]